MRLEKERATINQVELTVAAIALAAMATFGSTAMQSSEPGVQLQASNPRRGNEKITIKQGWWSWQHHCHILYQKSLMTP